MPNVETPWSRFGARNRHRNQPGRWMARQKSETLNINIRRFVL
jgi:hypothetical protein